MARKQTVKDSELKAILAEVEQEIGSLLKSERDKLAKAHPGEETSSEPPKDASATKDASDSSASSGDSGPPPPSAPETSGEDSSASPPAPDASASPAPMDGGGAGPAAPADPAADSATDVDMLVGEYSKLTPEELKAHYLAAKTAVMSLLGGGADASASPGTPPPAAPPGPPAPGPDASASPSAPPAMKMELDSIAPTKAGQGEDKLAAVQPKGKIGNGEDHLAATAVSKEELNLNPSPTGDNPGPPNGENPLKTAKSEPDAEILLLKSQIEEQNAMVDKLAQALTLVLTRPERKALTGVSYIAKSEAATKPVTDMSKAEIRERLYEVASNPQLKKSDRELINAWCIDSIDASKIAHLLTVK